VNRPRAVLRRLDAWAALVLGILVALGVIILVATPGPWHVVVRSAPQVRLVAPPPSDVAVFVNGTAQPGRCTGVVWLHMRYDPPSLAFVVVPPELQGGLGAAGFESLARIVRDAGPAAASRALGQTLKVRMGSWAYLDRNSLQTAFPGGLGGTETRTSRARLRALRRAWSAGEPAHSRFALQTSFLREVVGGSSLVGLNLVAFVNYVLAGPGVDTDLTLQGVSAIGTVLKTAPPDAVGVGALPVVNLQRGPYSRWLPQRLALLALRQAFAFDAATPAFRPVVTDRRLPSRVLVLTSESERPLLRAYRDALGRSLRVSAGRQVGVDVVPVATPIAALRVVERRAARPPLAVVVAIGRQRPAAPEGIEQGLRLLLATLRAAGQPAIVSEVPGTAGGAWTKVNQAIDRAAAASGTPLSPVAPLLTSPMAAVRPADVRLYARWAGLNAGALVRAVQPAYFAPDLLSTRSDFDYYQRTRTSVAVTGAEAIRVARQAASVANLGFGAVAGRPGDVPLTTHRALYYRPAAVLPALILAGELQLTGGVVTASPPPRSTDLALTVP
jgi:hypothetical protein